MVLGQGLCPCFWILPCSGDSFLFIHSLIHSGPPKIKNKEENVKQISENLPVNFFENGRPPKILRNYLIKKKSGTLPDSWFQCVVNNHIWHLPKDWDHLVHPALRYGFMASMWHFGVAHTKNQEPFLTLEEIPNSWDRDPTICFWNAVKGYMKIQTIFFPKLYWSLMINQKLNFL